jgi:hypothetical protein
MLYEITLLGAVVMTTPWFLHAHRIREEYARLGLAVAIIARPQG